MARMTAVAMLLPGLLVAFSLGAAIALIAVISIKPLHRDVCRATIVDDANATATCQNATSESSTHAYAVTASLQHALALNVPLHSLHDLVRAGLTEVPSASHLLLLDISISTLMALLWGMGVTHTQVRAWVHQQGLAVTAGLMKLKSATKCLLHCALTHAFHAAARRSPISHPYLSSTFPLALTTMLQQCGIFPLLRNTM
ncbi:unnamed protein product [Closterium sp. NIES-64]|nr:unnamed protein product [Closterium sp. NIES-64]